MLLSSTLPPASACDQMLQVERVNAKAAVGFSVNAVFNFPESSVTE